MRTRLQCETLSKSYRHADSSDEEDESAGDERDPLKHAKRTGGQPEDMLREERITDQADHGRDAGEVRPATMLPRRYQTADSSVSIA